MDHNTKTAVLFVCLGNICRSPLAEGVFKHLTRRQGVEHGYEIDSAGIGGWHAGESYDSRSTDVANRNGVTLEGVARQVAPGDFDRFDWIIAMDRENLSALEALQRRNPGKARLQLLRDFDPDPGNGEVPDPYYGSPRGFDQVYTMVRRSAESFLSQLEEERRGAGEEG